MDYSPIYTSDLILIVGNSISSRQEVPWSEIRDRFSGNNPPKLILINPRLTFTASKVTVHLTIQPGSIHVVMKGLLNLIIQAGYINEKSIKERIEGFNFLSKTISGFTPHKVQQLTGVPVNLLMNAACMLGNTTTLYSVVLNEFYDHATVKEVYNLHHVRGLIDKKGCGIYLDYKFKTRQRNSYFR
ncbi:MAG TPA: hypothetical protein VK179_18935 [Bacteroidales bacterium]|nr:hypothetical protein [Bacteroidales bacterium]